jgi:hypothetical protein
MKRTTALALAVLVLVAAAMPAFADAPTVSEKKDVAIFALGYYGWNIPLETLGSIDMEIQKVFVDLGRFNIIGVEQRLSSGGVSEFISALKKTKEASFVMPEKYQFGEAVLTEAEFNKLLGAFIVATPVVTEFDSHYDSKRVEWVTDIKTNVTFIDVAAGGSVLGIAEVKTSGSDKQSQNQSISSAIDSIPMQLQYEIRKIPAFQINTRVLAVSGSEIKLQLGQNMGIRKGDEYSVIVGGTVEGFKDEHEAGLVAIKDVGAEVSTGQVVYSSAKLGKDVQLREIPRMGVDFEPYIHLVGSQSKAFLPGFRAVASRGFYGFRPYLGVQIPLGQMWSFFGLATFIPVTAIFGGEQNFSLGRLSLTPYGGVGFSYVYYMDVSGTSTETNYFPHIGGQAYLRASYLVSRDMKIFAEVGGDYWIAISSLFQNYGGLGFGAGLAFKL